MFGILGMQCQSCMEIVVSLHRHDYNSCSCGGVALDGGFDYCRGAFNAELPMPQSVPVDEKMLAKIIRARKVRPYEDVSPKRLAAWIMSSYGEELKE